jgi:choline dehydrogenase-like flavoprotein
MGKSDPPAVADPQLWGVGVAGLGVVNASIMPNIASGENSSPTSMIDDRAPN